MEKPIKGSDCVTMERDAHIFMAGGNAFKSDCHYMTLSVTD